MINGRGYTDMQLIKELEFKVNDTNQSDIAYRVYKLMESALDLDMDIEIKYVGEDGLVTVRIYAKPKE